MIIDKACFERGCACYDDRVDGPGVEMVEKTEKQEPVAVVDGTISGHIDWLCVVFPKQGTKLYTTPQPQREWVGLTNEEIEIVSGDYTESEGFKHGARWALDQLKEKNQ